MVNNKVGRNMELSPLGVIKAVGGLEFEEGAVAGDLKDRLSKAETVKLTGRLKPFYKYFYIQIFSL